MENEEVCYTVLEFAKLLKYSPHGIRNLIKAGKIRAFQMDDASRSPFRIPISELFRFQQAGICKVNQTLKMEEEEI